MNYQVTAFKDFRAWSRNAWLLHAFILSSLVLGPHPFGYAVPIGTHEVRDESGGWIETRQFEDWNNSGAYDPGENSWVYDTVDSDNDGIVDAREIVWGTDSVNPDSDYDGITDGNEIDLLGGPASGFSPTHWDTDSDGYSDYDELYADARVHYPTHGSGYSYYDWDGDGVKNPEDSHPLNGSLVSDWNNSGTNDEDDGPPPVDSDGDGYADINDSHPSDPLLWSDADHNGFNDTQENDPQFDVDGDGYLNGVDSHPGNSMLWIDWNNNGINDDAAEEDRDGDGTSNQSDSHPENIALWSDWNNNGYNDDSEPNPVSDFDGDGYYDSVDSHTNNSSLWDDWNGNGFNDSFESVNSDSDTWPDYQDSNPLEPTLWSDWDHDELNSEDELLLGTYPENSDSDGDGLNDGAEVTYSTNPLMQDTDNDGLTDFDELVVYSGVYILGLNLDPKNGHSISAIYLDSIMVDDSDTDGDGIPDAVEDFYAPAMNSSDRTDADGDLDADNVPNLIEYFQGTRFDGNLGIYDYDRDGMTDVEEDYWSSIHPGILNKYVFEDSVQDPDGDGVFNFEEIQLKLDPNNPNTHLVDDLAWANSEHGEGWGLAVSPNDVDGDGMPDLWEHRHFLDIREASNAGDDNDNDLLVNLQEYLNSRNPAIFDAPPAGGWPPGTVYDPGTGSGSGTDGGGNPINTPPSDLDDDGVSDDEDLVPYDPNISLSHDSSAAGRGKYVVVDIGAGSGRYDSMGSSGTVVWKVDSTNWAAWSPATGQTISFSVANIESATQLNNVNISNINDHGVLCGLGEDEADGKRHIFTYNPYSGYGAAFPRSPRLNEGQSDYTGEIHWGPGGKVVAHQTYYNEEGRKYERVVFDSGGAESEIEDVQSNEAELPTRLLEQSLEMPGDSVTYSVGTKTDRSVMATTSRAGGLVLVNRVNKYKVSDYYKLSSEHEVLHTRVNEAFSNDNTYSLITANEAYISLGGRDLVSDSGMVFSSVSNHSPFPWLCASGPNAVPKTQAEFPNHLWIPGASGYTATRLYGSEVQYLLNAPIAHIDRVNLRGEALVSGWMSDGTYDLGVWVQGEATSLSKMVGPQVAADYFDWSWIFHGINDHGAVAASAISLFDFSARMLLLVPVDIVPDLNRDGEINYKDRNKVSRTDPYRYWINDDRDNEEIAAEELADTEADSGRDADDQTLKTTRDLVDFFPLYLDIKALLEVLPPGQNEYKLKHEESAVNVIFTNWLEANTNDTYLKPGAFQRVDHVREKFVKGPSATRPANSDGPPLDWVNHLTAQSIRIPKSWLEEARRNPNSAIILVEGAKVTKKPLQLVVTSASGDVEVDLPLSLGSVKNMYRWINLRDQAGEDSSADPSNHGQEPSNWPDAKCNGKSFVFVHGYSVSQKDARGWGAEVFKRMWLSGSNAKLHLVTWRGNQGQYASHTPWVGGLTPDYWMNVYNAFRTSPALAHEVGAIPGEKYIAGHSLGNMVISSAMVDHGLAVNRYFMINGAVPCEAYSPRARAEHSQYMTQEKWRVKNANGHLKYPADLQAARYADLFSGTNDNRKDLTWDGRFAGIQNVYQLYSSGENVLEPNRDGAMTSLADDAMKGYRAWVGQETTKGLRTKIFAQVISGLNTPQPGWDRFTAGWSFDRDTWDAPDAKPLTKNDKIGKPLFRPFNDNRAGASIHGAQGSALLQGWQQASYPINVNEPYFYMASLLAQDVPSLSWPAGSVAIRGMEGSDMMKLNDNGWPQERFANSPRAEFLSGRKDRWFHSDIKEISYFYTYKVYDLMVNKGGLK